MIRNGAAVPRYSGENKRKVKTRAAFAVAIASSLALSVHAQGTLPITRLAPDVYLIVAPSGNMVAQTGPSGIVRSEERRVGKECH